MYKLTSVIKYLMPEILRTKHRPRGNKELNSGGVLTNNETLCQAKHHLSALSLKSPIEFRKSICEFKKVLHKKMKIAIRK